MGNSVMPPEYVFIFGKTVFPVNKGHIAFAVLLVKKWQVAKIAVCNCLETVVFFMSAEVTGFSLGSAVQKEVPANLLLSGSVSSPPTCIINCKLGQLKILRKFCRVAFWPNKTFVDFGYFCVRF